MPLMGIPSFSELILIFGVALLFFGGKKLPELGGAIGESIKNFKKGIKDEDGHKTAPPPPAPTQATQSLPPPTTVTVTETQVIHTRPVEAVVTHVHADPTKQDKPS